MKKWIAAVLLATGLFGVLSAEATGIGFDRTRVVIENGASEGSLVLKNETNWAFLVRNSVENVDRQKTDKAAALPPIHKMMPGKSARVRIAVTNPEALPKDRESLFWLDSKAIPAKSDAENTVRFNYVSRLKVFYRPKGLAYSQSEAMKRQELSVDGGRLHIKNPTPYYITYGEYRLNGKVIDASDMVAPFSEKTVTLEVKKGDALSWSGVNDLGAMQPVEARLK
ncbi:MAG: hypothetical protein ACFWTZ_09325 [Burkholderia sp.]|jgi:fimbrial chaperone protein